LGVEREVNYSTIVGLESLKGIIDVLYLKLRLDDVTSPYFYGVDERKIKPHMVKLVWFLLGGENDYRGRPLDVAHRDVRARWERRTLLGKRYVETGPGIHERAWQHTGGHLLGAFTEAGFTSQGLHDHLASRLAEAHDLIVTDVEPRRRFARLRGLAGRRTRRVLSIGYVAALLAFLAGMDWYVAEGNLTYAPDSWTTWGLLGIGNALGVIVAVRSIFARIRRWRGQPA
jgi:hypothetical protein